MAVDHEGAGLRDLVTLRFADDGEARVVTLGWRADGSLELGETLEGELVRQVFGESPHHHRVVVGAEALEGAATVLPGEGSAKARAEGFLANGDAMLGDVMDLLDQALVPYTYLCISQRGAVLRPAC